MFGLCQIFEINTIVQKMNTRYTIRKMVLVQKWKKKCTTYTKKNILISKKNQKSTIVYKIDTTCTRGLCQKKFTVQSFKKIDTIVLLYVLYNFYNTKKKFYLY